VQAQGHTAPKHSRNRGWPGRLDTPRCTRLLLSILTKIKNCIDRHKQTHPTPPTAKLIVHQVSPCDSNTCLLSVSLKSWVCPALYILGFPERWLLLLTRKMGQRNTGEGNFAQMFLPRLPPEPAFPVFPISTTLPSLRTSLGSVQLAETIRLLIPNPQTQDLNTKSSVLLVLEEYLLKADGRSTSWLEALSKHSHECFPTRRKGRCERQVGGG
jgi:hypothetical protein